MAGIDPRRGPWRTACGTRLRHGQQLPGDEPGHLPWGGAAGEQLRQPPAADLCRPISEPALSPGDISIAITSVYNVIAAWIPGTVAPRPWPR
jgi:hypothetical protein